MRLYATRGKDECRQMAKHYELLTPEERFRLILLAGARGDTAEQRRLIRAGKTISFSVADHTPLAQAFNEVAQLIYLELLERAHWYLDEFDTAARQEPGPDATDTEVFHRFDSALAAGFLLRSHCEGWKVFCERLSVPPFALWSDLPGFHRLEGALAFSERAAFHPDGYLCWLKRHAPPGQPEPSMEPHTPESISAGIDRLFRKRLFWWQGF